MLFLCFQTRVLVTHGLGYLPQCDVIVTIENGLIREIGAYAELIDNNGAFAEFVRTYASMEDSDEEGDAGTYTVNLLQSQKCDQFCEKGSYTVQILIYKVLWISWGP